MAIKILNRLIASEAASEKQHVLRLSIVPNVPVVHNIHHDLESFVWVTLHAILCHEIIADRRYIHFKGLNDRFMPARDLFGNTAFKSIQSAKWMALTPSSSTSVRDLIPAGILYDLVDKLLKLVVRQNPMLGMEELETLMTYESILAVFNEALSA